MCAHIGQNRHIYRRVYTGYIFDSIPPPPFPQVDGGGCYRENFFLFFSELFDLISFARLLTCFCLYSILILTRLKFIILNSIFFICFVLYSSRLDCSIPDIKLRLVFTRIKLCRFYALSLQLFISLSLLLVINKHLCLYEFVLCLFWLF